MHFHTFVQHLTLTIGLWWYEELMFNAVPCNLNKFYQNALTNTLSLLDTIDFGMPCNLTTLEMNASATVLLV